MISRREFLRLSAVAGVPMAGQDIPFFMGNRPITPSTAKAKRVIWLHMAGGPSPLDLFDPKPEF